MRKLFFRFYLTVVVSFLISVLVIGSIYKNVVRETNNRYLTDIFETSLYLIERELSDYPEAEWRDAINNIRNRIPVPVQIEPIDTYVLQPDNENALRRGDIIRLEDSNLFLQRIPHSEYIVTMGPVTYLHFISTLQWVDVLAILSLCLTLGVPAFLWMRPLWRHSRQLSEVSRRLGSGDFAARADLPSSSALSDLSETINAMAANIEELIASRKAMIDAVSHDLRTPIARLRYRLEALHGVTDTPLAHKVIGQIGRDIDSLSEMTEELLLLGSLERPELSLDLQDIRLEPWLEQLLSGIGGNGLAPPIINAITAGPAVVRADPYYLGRAITNLAVNARRYCKEQVQVTLEWHDGLASLHVDDDGPGIPADSREQVLQPFTRLEQSRNRQTGGYGLGLAIVQRIMRWHGGTISIDQSPLGGARLTLSWPTPLVEDELEADA